MRKMRSLLHFIKPLIGKETYNELNTSLRETSYRLEPLREADVLIESCGERALEEPDLLDDYAEVFRYLHNDRRKSMRSRLTESMIAAFESTIKDTKLAIDQLDFDNEKIKSGDWKPYLEERLVSKKKKVLTLFKDADRSDHKAAHDVRKKAKKLRYAASGNKDLLPSKLVKKVKKKSRTIQNELGLISDLYTNSERLTAYSKKAKDPSLKHAFTKLAEKQIIVRDEVISTHSNLNES